jgi:fused signal recognition particle receptor
MSSPDTPAKPIEGKRRWFSRKSTTQTDEKTPQPQTQIEADVESGLAATRQGLLAKIGNVFKGTFDLDDELFDELEETLMTCDIGARASLSLVDRLRERVTREKIQDQRGVLAGLQQEIAELLAPAEQAWTLDQSPSVVLVVGVNGVGKTTTTAKIAHQLKLDGKTVMLAAADTFRAAAVDQLIEWGARLDIPVISQGTGADAAAVAHDALMAATARSVDVLLIDTAGRLHTQTELMEQLEKVVRVIRKFDSSAPHHVIQVLDAGTGQNALSQLEHFQKAVDVSGLCLTKLDGSARGGVALSLTERFGLPIYYIGVGEQADDLKPFKAKEFAAGLIDAKTT